ncbi:MAG: hypothetical protein A2V93_01820 [Ignavibacteria bacterium RBG_16_34_14]|nr:MAG: hypothetical protein A2V93_01820 [Ignavibacteria bacterium RBG_16_34_14]
MKSQTNKHQTFQVLISIDEPKLRSEREGIDYSFIVKDAIQSEFAWLNQSGIYLEKIWETRTKKKRRMRL